ncbi:MAG: N-6 DNA methylase [Neisseriaceae bacterium]|nr:N-6 DNA methylase [Neisseriaceae bacterium]
MAGLGVKDQISPLEIEDLKGLTGKTENDGIKIINKIEEFLNNKELPQDKQEIIISELKKYFNNPNYYKSVNGESKIKTVYRAVKNDILPFFTEVRQIDLTGQLFNTLNKWVKVPDGAENDVVLTPRYVTRLMARLCQVNKDSFVWDYATGSGGFLISSMELMIADAKAKINSPQEVKQKELQIKSEQLLGIEKLPDIYILAVLNMILMGDGSSHILNQDSLEFNGKYGQGRRKDEYFPADIFLLNPPYSAKGKGMIFVEQAFAKMKKGRGAVIIQNSAGSGQATEFNRKILANNTLLASIRMPNDIFKTSVNTCIYLFDIGTEHDSNKQVLFIDFSNDGYTRSYRKKTSATNNLKNTDHAIERYDEIVDIVLDRKRKTNYYQDGKEVIKDTITLLGNDWNFDQHQKTDTMPQLADFKKTVADYLSYEVNQILSGSLKTENPLGKY